MLAKIKNKRAQLESSTVLWGIAIIFLVAVAIGIWIYTSKVNEVPGTLPQAVALAAQGCEVSITGGDMVGFCSEKQIKVGSSTQYMDCSYIKKQYSGTFEDLNCPVDNAVKICLRFKGADSKFDNSTLVNGQACKDYTCAAAGGIPQDKPCDAGQTSLITYDTTRTNICCKVKPAD